MRYIPYVIGLCLASFFAPRGLAADLSPYAGQQEREIKAFSRQDMEDLIQGRGMGLAKAGELNGYPGPAHVLDLASKLRLTDEQIRLVTAIKDRMSAAAIPQGKEIIRRERELEQEFTTGHVTEPDLTAETEAIGQLQGRLRSIHLAAHIETKRVLTPDQVARYITLRGYGSADNSPMTHEHMMGHGGASTADVH